MCICISTSLITRDKGNGFFTRWPYHLCLGDRHCQFDTSKVLHGNKHGKEKMNVRKESECRPVHAQISQTQFITLSRPFGSASSCCLSHAKYPVKLLD